MGYQESFIFTNRSNVEKNNSEPIILIGSAVQHDNASVGIVRSTLDALNRSISKLC